MSKQYSKFFEHLPVGLCLVDSSMRIRYWNRCLERWTEMPRQEVLGKTLNQVFPHLASKKYQLRLNQVLDTGLPAVFSPQIHTGLFPCDRRDGSPRDLQSTVTRVALDDGWGIMIVNEDVSELTGLIRKYRTAQTELETQKEYLKDFAAAAGHDLSEPLRQISALSSLAKTSLDTENYEQAREVLRLTQESAQKLQSLIRALMNHARSSGLEHDTKVDLESVVGEVISSLGPSGLGVSFEVSRLPSVTGSRPALLQLFQNLVGNAIKYRSEKKPVVRISSEPNSELVSLCVQDNGLGIEGQYLETIFHPFKRLHSHSEIPGSGLGLATCKKIVELHGGRIWVTSELGAGCSFYFTLPKWEEPELLKGA